MDKRTLKALEFGKVLEHLAGFCVSEAGRAASLDLHPLQDVHAVREAQTLFDEARTWAGESEFRLGAFPDLSGVLAFLDSQAAVLDLDAFWALRETLGLARQAVLSLGEGTRWPRLHELAHAAPLPEMLLSALGRCLGDDGALRDESTPELALIRGELRRLHQSCLRRVKDFAVQYNIGHYLQDEYMTLASDRYVLPLKSNFKGRVQGVIHDYSNTGETCYFEPMFLVEQNNRLQELKREEREEERKVLRYLTDLTRGELPFVQAALAFLVRLDLELAKAGLGAAFDGLCVHVDPDAPLSLLEARHPLLALDPDLRRHGGPSPVDLVLRREDRVLVISGGNAGGKTVCLKTLGIMAAMTLSGLPVPAARGSTMPWWPEVQAFIGDEQSLDDHVSTFTAQIRYLAQAWERMDRRTLVLLDEFGAGTDPAQGAALAQGVLDELLARDVHVVAATHFPALKTYALTRDKVRAASVLFDPRTKRPLFRLAYDQVGASQALDVAREHGLPEAVLRRAEQYLLLEGQDMTAIMDRLNALAVQREKDVDALRVEKAETAAKRARYQERFEKDRERLHAEVKALSSKVMAEWKAHKISHKQALKELAQARVQLASPLPDAVAPAPVVPEGLTVGQQVMHRPWNKRAVVREVDSRQNRVRLDMNGVTLWADAAQVRPVEEASPASNAGRSGAVLRRASEEISLLRLDLRGKRADLALSELGQFLDRGLLSGMDGVEVIHGRGTGVLRKEVHGFLRTFPGIDRFELAPEDQGGDGVTLVFFR